MSCSILRGLSLGDERLLKPSKNLPRRGPLPIDAVGTLGDSPFHAMTLHEGKNLHTRAAQPTGSERNGEIWLDLRIPSLVASCRVRIS